MGGRGEAGSDADKSSGPVHDGDKNVLVRSQWQDLSEAREDEGKR